MTTLQVVSFIGIPVTALLAAVVLIAFARPDQGPDGTYAGYLALGSLFSLFTLLLSGVTCAEAVAGHAIVGPAPNMADGFRSISISTLALAGSTGDGDLAPAIGWGAVFLTMSVSFGFHSRRRAELLAEGDTVVARIERAYGAAACFAMLQLVVIGAVVAGVAAYQFIDRPIGLEDDRVELTGANALIYGVLVAVAFLIFRTYFWRIRGTRDSSGNDTTGDEELVPVADVVEQ